MLDMKYIVINKNKNTKCGFVYVFRYPNKNLVQVPIKSSTSYEKIIKYRNEWLSSNSI